MPNPFGEKASTNVIPGGYPGVLITFEGGDGCGKTTHSEFLENVLASSGCDVVHVREPGGTGIGERLREILLDPDSSGLSPRSELLIYEAARAQLVDDVILPALIEGKVVICDRFTDSTVVYQGYGRGIDLEEIEHLNGFATGSVSPDVTLVLHCSNRSEKKERIDRREAKDRLEMEGHDFHTRVIDAFLEIPAEYPDRVKLIDTGGLHSDTAKLIFDAVSEAVPELADAFADADEALNALDAAHDHSPDPEGCLQDA